MQCRDRCSVIPATDGAPCQRSDIVRSVQRLLTDGAVPERRQPHQRLQEFYRTAEDEQVCSRWVHADLSRSMYPCCPVEHLSKAVACHTRPALLHG